MPPNTPAVRNRSTPRAMNRGPTVSAPAAAAAATAGSCTDSFSKSTVKPAHMTLMWLSVVNIWSKVPGGSWLIVSPIVAVSGVDATRGMCGTQRAMQRSAKRV